MSTPASLSTLGTLTTAGLVAMAIGIGWTRWLSGAFTRWLSGGFVVPAFVSRALALRMAFLVTTGIRWMPPATGAHGPSSRPTGSILSPRQRKLVLAAHIIISVGLLGISAAMLVLGIVGATTSDPGTSKAVYLSMGIFTNGVIQPAAAGALATGLILSLGTKWGLLKHYWIVVKLALTVAAVACGIFVVRPSVQQAIAATAEAAPLTVAGLQSAPILLIVGSGANVLMLGAATVISVYKPWGAIRRRHRGIARPTA